jgi:glycosyltransferase involved in cell wall biosynthesis
MKKVLIITYYWPPAGGPGVHRPLKLAEYFLKHSIKPFILTVKNGQYQAYDHVLEESVSRDITVVKTKTWEPYSLFKKLTGKKSDTIESHQANSNNKKMRVFQYVRNNIFIPDPRIGWYFYAIPKVLNLIEREQINAIISTSPPPTVHIIAAKLAKKTQRPWIMDYRDPWSQNFRIQHRNRISAFYDHLLEIRTQKLANIITLTSADFIPFIHSKYQNKIKVIPNGFEPLSELNKNRKFPSVFQILHFGSISYSQNPVKLFQSVTKWNSSQSKKIVIQFVGQVDPAINNYIIENNYQDFVSIKTSVTQNEFHSYLSSADVGLLCLHPYKTGTGNIPLKMFDYFKYQIPILSIGNPSGHAAKIINHESIGLCRSYKDEIKENDLLKLFSIKGYPDSIEKEYAWATVGHKFVKLVETL